MRLNLFNSDTSIRMNPIQSKTKFSIQINPISDLSKPNFQLEFGLYWSGLKTWFRIGPDSFGLTYRN